MSTITEDSTLGELVAERPSRARVFEQLDLDYCCGGDRILTEAAASAGLDPSTVVRTLQAAEASGNAAGDSWADASPDELIAHIESTHHDYLRDELPRLEQLIGKVASVHGEEAPWMVSVKEVFADLKPDLEAHMVKEEEVVFPFIQSLQSEGEPAGMAELDGDPLAILEEEHDASGEALRTIRDLTDDYTVPDWACGTFRAAVDGLCELEEDMHRHVHKENSILFPKARKLADSA